MSINIPNNPIFNRRISNLQSTLDSTTAFFTADKNDIYYLSGCTGSNNFMLILEKQLYICTDGRYLTQIHKQMQIDLTVKKIDNTTTLLAVLTQILKDHTIQSLRFTVEGISYSTGQSLFSNLPKEIQILEDNTIQMHRSYKDPMEIEIICHNLLITKAAFLYIQGIIRPGISEREIATELEYYCYKQGASSMAFDPIIASGPRSALPHGNASDKIIEDNELIQLDFGIIKDYYCSDFSRVIMTGKKINQKLYDIHQIVLEALQLVEKTAQCGMTGQEIDTIARNYIIKKGYGDYFVHGLGHSLGLAVHENPRLNQISKEPIKENTVLTIEPGIYVEGLGGIRLEDVVVMRPNGFELLTECRYDL